MLDFLKKGFEKTFGAISSAKKSTKIDKESLEEILLEADVVHTFLLLTKAVSLECSAELLATNDVGCARCGT